ncbi:MAG: hypothetical protein CMB80_05505 [Flammeovirgaceae bacterium]|nr:hypothetical protein [Flammeovirgaceae bacterium]|tara:strand:+ start:6849 stop:7208 length:360 start_codon:yes stop_codon:yes gene_type:complete
MSGGNSALLYIGMNMFQTYDEFKEQAAAKLKRSHELWLSDTDAGRIILNINGDGYVHEKTIDYTFLGLRLYSREIGIVIDIKELDRLLRVEYEASEKGMAEYHANNERRKNTLAELNKL